MAERALEDAATAGERASTRPVVIIKPSRGWRGLDLRELWKHRELLMFFVWRDVKVRYKQTALGAGWAVIQPLAIMAVLTVVFGYLADLPSDGIPYPVFAFAALLPWQLFTNAFNRAANSLVTSQQLITKVYFPRILIPTAAVFVGLLDFLVGFVILLLFLVYYGIAPDVTLLALPLFVALALAAALAIGYWLSALNVRYRDVSAILPFLTQFWFYATPIAYSSTLVPEEWRSIVGLNPMAGVVEGVRWTFFPDTKSFDPLVFVSAGTVLVLLVSGVLYFRRVERTFADVV